MRGNWSVAGGLLVLSGCMASGVRFAGSRQTAVATPDGVAVGVRPPAGARQLGRASVECAPLAPDEDVQGVRLSDLSCSARFLRSALREGAADAGGTFLQEPECRDKRSAARITWMGCDADVWGPADARAEGAAARVAPFASVQDAWHISIDFWPAPGRARATAREAGSVSELDFPRVGQVRLGDVSATCDEGCAEHSLRQGLRAVAAWPGATSLVDVRCIQQEQTTSCAGSISTPEHEEGAMTPATAVSQAARSARD
ncbi:MAG: hypothetical protein ABI895_32455 [Deltaproteobacteria bacterium]